MKVTEALEYLPASVEHIDLAIRNRSRVPLFALEVVVTLAKAHYDLLKAVQGGGLEESKRNVRGMGDSGGVV